MGMFQLPPSWKTTAAGLSILASGVATLAHMAAAGPFDPSLAYVTITTMIGGVGLIFAKDANVTSATPSNPSATVLSAAQVPLH